MTAVNHCFVPVTFEMDVSHVVNIEPSVSFPMLVTLEPEQKRDLVSFRHMDKSKSYDLKVLPFTPHAGRKLPEHDLTARYQWPFGGDVPRKLTQGVGGKQTHLANARYSFDFGMPVGSPVVAARDGVVYQVLDGFGKGGFSKRYMFRSNTVRVLHDDGTTAAYAHLLKGIPVKPGQVLRAGDLLGRSGESGYAGSPHLHFHVNGPYGSTQSNGVLPTIPILFVGDLVPEEGKKYGPFGAK